MSTKSDIMRVPKHELNKINQEIEKKMNQPVNT